MRILLDTQVFLWFIMGHNRLSQMARSPIENVENKTRWQATALPHSPENELESVRKLEILEHVPPTARKPWPSQG